MACRVPCTHREWSAGEEQARDDSCSMLAYNKITSIAEEGAVYIIWQEQGDDHLDENVPKHMACACPHRRSV